MELKRVAHVKNVISKLYREQTHLQIIIGYYFFCLNKILTFLTIFYCHSFKIHGATLNSEIDIYDFPQSMTLYIYDYGIQFYGKDIDCTIPYEHILSFGPKNNIFTIEIFAKIVNSSESGVKFIYSNNKTYIKFKSDNNKKITNLMEKNMKYHIIHNNLNLDVLDYYIYKQA